MLNHLPPICASWCVAIKYKLSCPRHPTRCPWRFLHADNLYEHNEALVIIRIVRKLEIPLETTVWPIDEFPKLSEKFPPQEEHSSLNFRKSFFRVSEIFTTL